ncbi:MULTISPECIES: membrane protein insertase YidC [Cycloclasticus]|jgi:YidC/Oxa1 family membrane protein insertase|uniref:membrane protein insertase YidC n=1 Tax=Cycloclasticus TaxID=34067 RepID=UPI000C0E817F|nr:MULTISPECIES: membrane protein insertase YidC [Cycloclasticus]MDF1829490.1 membrane protein insertase YidC [Cycloclasticus pugetii]PHR50193.1 MAG: membrane protein insertase YidC [Cycloclasticus sp.]
MDNQRTLLFAALAFIAVLIWQAWQKDYVLPQQIQQQVQSEGVNSSTDVPNVAKSEPLPTGVNQETEPKDLALKGGVIEVITDVYELKIDKVGGNIVNLYLTQYPDTKGLEETVQLLNNTPSKTFVVESGLIVQNGESPNHHALWSASDSQYVMTDDELRVPLTWKNESGIEVTKTYVFSKGSYKVDVETSIENNGSNSWSAREYLQIKRNDYADKKANSMIYTYTGGVLYTDEDKYQKIDFDDMEDENLSQEATGGWAGMIQHYFGVAWVPEKENNYTYYTKALSAGKYVIGAYSPMTVVEPGQRKTINSVLFAGPKLQEQLKEIAPGLELMVDYGKLTIIAEPIFWLLSFFYDFVGNWGVAIIMVTFTIKALFFKLSEKSYKSMAHMKLVQPRIVALKERYGDDKQQLNKAMMELYKTEKINPLSGCLPILIQIPVFIALYWTLLESVELRQAPFALWIDNLSAADPYFILPVIYGITMFFQQRLNPAPVDPMQKKVMQMLPIMFTGFFAFFPAGLVLYWIVNNLLTIAQQTVIMKRIESGKEK